MLVKLGADTSLTTPAGLSALGCYREAKRAGRGRNMLAEGTDVAVETLLTPPAGPTAADEAAAVLVHGMAAWNEPLDFDFKKDPFDFETVEEHPGQRTRGVYEMRSW